MPVDIQALPSDSINTKWKDPYASASLNRRPVGITPPGIYRGLALSTDPLSGDRTVNIESDPDSGDHVAVFENEDGFSLNYRDEASGDMTISLTAYSSVDVVISLFVDYQIGLSTSGIIRSYTQAEFDGLSPSFRNSLVVVGTVSVPASGAIGAGSLSLNQRTLASQNIQKGTIQNAPIIRNNLFEIGETGQSYELSSHFWRKTASAGAGTWTTSTDRAESGTKSIKLEIATAPFSGEISQQAGIGTTTGELLICSIAVWQDLTISSGLFQFFVEFSDSNGDLLATLTQNLDGGIDTGWRTVSPIIQSPAGAVSIRSFGVRCTALDPSSVGTFAYIDSIEINVESADPQLPYPFDQRFRQRVGASSIQLIGEDGNFSDISADISFNPEIPSGEGSISVSSVNPSSLPPALELAGRMIELGSQLLATGANALKARISAEQADSGVSTYTLMWETFKSGVQGSRTYVKHDGTLINTGNARWNGTNWVKDVNTVEASMTEFGTDGTWSIFVQGAGIDVWADGAWTANTILALSSAGDFSVSSNASFLGQVNVGTAAVPDAVFSLFSGGLKVGTAVIDPAAEELIVSGKLKIEDVDFYAEIESAGAFPKIAFDGANDSIGYHRANNQFQFGIGNQLRLAVDDNGISSRSVRPSGTHADPLVSRFEMSTRNVIALSCKIDTSGVVQGRPWNVFSVTNLALGTWYITATETLTDDTMPLATCQTTNNGFIASAIYNNTDNRIEVRSSVDAGSALTGLGVIAVGG